MFCLKKTIGSPQTAYMKYPEFQRWQLDNFRAVWRFRWENPRVMVPRIQVLALGPLSPRLHPALRSDMRTSLGPEVGVPSSNVAGKSSNEMELQSWENHPYWTFQQTIFDHCTINIHFVDIGLDLEREHSVGAFQDMKEGMCRNRIVSPIKPVINTRE